MIKINKKIFAFSIFLTTLNLYPTQVKASSEIFIPKFEENNLNFNNENNSSYNDNNNTFVNTTNKENNEIEPINNDNSTILNSNVENNLESSIENTVIENQITEEVTEVKSEVNNINDEEITEDLSEINSEITKTTENSEEIVEEVTEETPKKIDIENMEKTVVVHDATGIEVNYISKNNYPDIIPNEMNDIIIAMYHGVSADIKDNDSVHRSIKGFKEDLELMYQNGYRPISMEDLMSNNISIEAGLTPIVITFDDGLSSTFSLTKDENGNFIPVTDTAVDILEKFNESHSDFGTFGMFYLYTSQRPFKGEGTVLDAINYLTDKGYEIGNHTYSHPFLTKLSASEIQKEMALSTKYIHENSNGITTKYVAYPYGEIPGNWLDKYLLNGEYDGYSYNFHSGVLATPNMSTSTLVYSNKFDKYKVGRYRGTNNSVYDLNWKIQKDLTNNSQFISDGDPDTITILDEDFHKINLNTVKDKTLVVITD